MMIMTATSVYFVWAQRDRCMRRVALLTWHFAVRSKSRSSATPAFWAISTAVNSACGTTGIASLVDTFSLCWAAIHCNQNSVCQLDKSLLPYDRCPYRPVASQKRPCKAPRTSFAVNKCCIKVLSDTILGPHEHALLLSDLMLWWLP